MRTTLPVVAIAAVLLTGCGSTTGTGVHPKGEASKSAADVLTDALAVAHKASSVHISGRIRAPGQGLFSFDLSTTRTASTGELNFAGLAFEFIRLGDDLYMKGGAAFARQIGATSLRGKWIRVSVKSPALAAFGTYTTSAPYFSILDDYKSSTTNVGVGIHNHGKVILLYDQDEHVMLYVALPRPWYPIGLVGPGPHRDSLTFDDWNASVSPKAPSGAIGLPGLSR